MLPHRVPQLRQVKLCVVEDRYLVQRSTRAGSDGTPVTRMTQPACQ